MRKMFINEKPETTEPGKHCAFNGDRSIRLPISADVPHRRNILDLDALQSDKDLSDLRGG